jgi:lipid-binding SYLF domain-containing protein
VTSWVTVGAVALALGSTPASADDAQDARQLVERARLTVEQFQQDPNMGGLRDLAKRAKGMLILPQMFRAAFIVGGSGGSGVLVARDDRTGRGVTKLLSPQVKLGADISVTAGPVGAGAAAGTAGLSADLVSYSMAKGLYGGFSVDGSIAGVRTALNEAFYGKAVSPADILIKGEARNPQADALLERVTQLAGSR